MLYAISLFYGTHLLIIILFYLDTKVLKNLKKKLRYSVLVLWVIFDVVLTVGAYDSRAHSLCTVYGDRLGSVEVPIYRKCCVTIF